MYHIWDKQNEDWYYGRYGGLKDIGKLYKTEQGAKQALRGYWGQFASDCPTPFERYPSDEIRAAGQHNNGPIAIAWRERFWQRSREINASWELHKKKSFHELFGSRFELREL